MGITKSSRCAGRDLIRCLCESLGGKPVKLGNYGPCAVKLIQCLANILNTRVYIYTYIEHVDHTVDMSYSYMSYMLHMVCIYIYIHITCYICYIKVYDLWPLRRYGGIPRLPWLSPSRRRDHRGARVIPCADVGAAGEHLRASAAAESCRW